MVEEKIIPATSLIHVRTVLEAAVRSRETVQISTKYESEEMVQIADDINTLITISSERARAHAAAESTLSAGDSNDVHGIQTSVLRDLSDSLTENYIRAKALRDLSDNLAGQTDDLQASFRCITECAAAHLEVSRCSLWLYSDGRQSIQCMDLYTRDDQEHSSGFELRAHDYPRYFEAIASERVIVANNAHTSPLTSEFSETYLKPQKIMAMLDAPIRVEGKLVGVVCNEQTRKVRTWSVSDQMFAASIGDFAAQAIESARLAESRKTLARIRRIGQIGYWSLKLPNEEFQCSPELVQMLDDDLSNPINTLDSFIEHITAEDRQKFVEVVERSRSGIDNLEVEFDITTGDGIPRSMVCIIHLKFDFAQNLKGIHASCRDVTELSLMRLADAARIRAESAILTLQQHQDALTSTLATLVHDVRTPLTSIKLGLARLVDKRLNAEEILPAMRSEVEYMDALFSNLIALVRMDMDYARSSSEAYDLGRVLEQVQHRFQFLAEDNQIRLELALPEETAIQTGDTVAMQQAISNIVHNAIKFAQGNVAILLYSDKDTNIVEVRDDGPGFVDDEIERLRDRYFTGQQAPRVGRFGTGLGLTIANDLIIRMKGELLLMNDSEGGAHVQIRLPRED